MSYNFLNTIYVRLKDHKNIFYLEGNGFYTDQKKKKIENKRFLINS